MRSGRGPFLQPPWPAWLGASPPTSWSHGDLVATRVEHKPFLPLPPPGLSAAVTHVPASGADCWSLEDGDPVLSFARPVFSTQPGRVFPGQLIHRLGRLVKKPSLGGVGPARGLVLLASSHSWPWLAVDHKVWNSLSEPMEQKPTPDKLRSLLTWGG